MKSKKKIKKSETSRKVAKFFSGLRLESWYFTIVFFCVIFIASLVVWKESFYETKPSEKVLIVFNSTEENFEQMKTEAMEAVEVLKGRISRYETVTDFSGTRELFVKIGEEGEGSQGELSVDKNENSTNIQVEQTEGKIETENQIDGGEVFSGDENSPGVVQ